VPSRIVPKFELEFVKARSLSLIFCEVFLIFYLFYKSNFKKTSAWIRLKRRLLAFACPNLLFFVEGKKKQRLESKPRTTRTTRTRATRA
jgi:hypothetical protein